jgi:hypothetical protein
MPKLEELSIDKDKAAKEADGKKEPKKPREKKKEYQGSKWTSLVVMIMIIITGLILSLTARH